ncbi:MFS transporter [Actinomadura rudentiformis]|uniref:MFS transporter n=1 Tax=Actinomadura rudentiformis TaxID=359158 RepID=A0A6H9YWZ8_9ACTN|nr:MFS transporter [Actinomadura rudentiformis]KAB2345561.1 MFS transporter [Actinomadura rudentiformis]
MNDVRRPRVVWTLVLAPLGVFLTSLDIVVVATALPVLRVELNASLADLEWTINAYNLVFACLMLSGAALGDRFGRRRMFVVGLAVFSLASAAAAMSSNAEALIVARMVQGVGAAVILPLTLVLIVDAFPAGKRGAAIGIWGAVAGLGVAAGPVVGGAITEGLSWQWIFWVNVPVGLAAAGLSTFLLRESRGPRPQLDLIGLVLAGIGVFALTWAPVRAPLVGWGSAEVVGALVAGVVFLGAFLRWESRTAHPMVPLGYFRARGFATSNVVAFLQQISLIGSLFIIAQLFQVGMGYSPWEAGLRILVWNGTLMLTAPVAGALADRFGNRPFMALGMVMQAGGLAWLAAVVEPGVGYVSLVGPLIVSGIGISAVMPTVANAVTASVPLEDAGVASGVNSALRELGSVFGVAIIALVFAGQGGYSSPEAFIDGFVPAMWAAAGIAVIGVLPAVLSPSRVSVSAPVRERVPEGVS